MRRVVLGCFLLVGLLTAAPAQAGWFSPCWVPCAPVDCGPCMVPKMVKEKRVIRQVVCDPVVREKKIQVCRRVPETHMQKRICTIMVPQQEMREVCVNVCTPVWREVEQTICVPVPEVVTRKAMRTVCRRVPVQSSRMVCVDEGSWCEQPDGCGGTCKVWVPKMVQKEIPCTTYKLEYDQVPYEYKCTVFRQELRKRKIKVCDYKYDMVTKQVPCTRYVPKQVEREFPVCTFKVVREEKTIKYTEMVPRTVEREIEVMVCHWVPAEMPAVATEKAATQKATQKAATQK